MMDTNRYSGRIVELVGVAGAGKSTISKFAKGELHRAGIDTLDLKDALVRLCDEGLIQRVAAFIGLPHPVRARLRGRLGRLKRRGLREFCKTNPEAMALIGSRLARIRRTTPHEAERIEEWVHSHAASYELLNKSRSGWALCLCEEGIATRLVNLFASIATPNDLEGFHDCLATWPLPDAVVHVQVDMKTAFSRVEERGRPKRLAGATQQEMLRFLKNSSYVVGAISEEARRRGIPVFEIDNSPTRECVTPDLSRWTACAEGLIHLADQ